MSPTATSSPDTTAAHCKIDPQLRLGFGRVRCDWCGDPSHEHGCQPESPQPDSSSTPQPCPDAPPRSTPATSRNQTSNSSATSEPITDLRPPPPPSQTAPIPDSSEPLAALCLEL